MNFRNCQSRAREQALSESGQSRARKQAVSECGRAGGLLEPVLGAIRWLFLNVLRASVVIRLTADYTDFADSTQRRNGAEPQQLEFCK
jgi:hypothetical protein